MSSIHKFGLGLALSLLAACVHSQVSQVDDPLRLTVSENHPFSGEWEHTFDSAFNKTTARFSASLRSPNVFLDLFLGPPNVHFLVASYDFPERRLVDPPDFVRLTLYSREVIQAELEGPTPGRRNLNLALAFHGWATRYPLAISEKTEDVLTLYPAVAGHLRDDLGHDVRPQRAGQVRHVSIDRTATAWIPTGDFLRLASLKSISGDVAGLDFRVGDRVLLGLREFAAQMNPRQGAPEL